MVEVRVAEVQADRVDLAYAKTSDWRIDGVRMGQSGVAVTKFAGE